MRENMGKFMSTFVAICIFSSCSVESKKTEDFIVQKTDDNENVIIADFDQNQEDICHASSFFKKATPIILDNRGDGVIGSVDKFSTFNDLIIILDSRISKSVFLYDKRGYFVRKIGRTGIGPGEYIVPNDFSIDEENNIIYIIDGSLQRIFMYNLPDGEFLKSIDIKDRSVRSHYIQYISGKLYANADSYIETDNDYLLREIDLNTGEQTGCWLKNEEYTKGYHYRYGNNTFGRSSNPFRVLPYSGHKFLQDYMNTVISIDEKGVSPYLYIKSRNFATDEDVQSLLSKDRNNVGVYGSDKISSIQNIIEANDFLFLSYLEARNLKVAMYNKNSGETSTYRYISDDLTSEIDLDKKKFGIPINFIYSDKEGAYSLFEGFLLEQLLKNIRNGDLNLVKEDMEKLKTLDEDSNPVLFYYEYK